MLTTGDRVKNAAEEAAWLVARGYPQDEVATFVSQHRTLSAKERELLECHTRCSTNVRHHIARELDPEDVRKRPLRIDAESVLCVVAAAASGAQLLESAAGLLCDPSWTRGSTAWSDAHTEAVARCFAALAPLKPKELRWLAAGHWQEHLTAALAPLQKKHKLRGDVEATDVAPALEGAAFVVSADPLVLDRCGTWLNITQLAAGDDVNRLCLE